MTRPRVSAIAALGKKTRTIGERNNVPWDIPDDLKRFKRITRGHLVITGRKTFESILSILGKPLPGRTNIVITRQTDYGADGAVVAPNVNNAIERAEELDEEEIFIIGGQQIYAQALPFIDRLYLTLVNSDKEGDTRFPAYENEFTRELEREEHETDDDLSYTWVTLERA
jgi:dihydrofolate reductase